MAQAEDVMAERGKGGSPRRGARIWGVLAGGALLVYLLSGLALGRLGESPLSAASLLLPSGLLEWLRAHAGLAVSLTFPGAFLAPLLPTREDSERSWLALRIVSFSLLAHLVNLTVLKLLGIEVRAPLMLALGGGETALAFLIAWVGRRGQRRAAGMSSESLRSPAIPIEQESSRSARTPAHPIPARSSRWIAPGLLLCAGLGLALAWEETLVRELDAYWYSAVAMSGRESGSEEMSAGLEDPWRSPGERGVGFRRGEDWREVPAERPLYRLDEIERAQTIELTASSPTPVRLRYLWKGPVGSGLRIDCEDLRAEGRILMAPTELPEEGPTLRYLDRGTVLVGLEVVVREARTCRLIPVGLDVLEDWSTPVAIPTQASGTILELTAWPAEALGEAGWTQDWPLTHYYQILNLAENVAWARATLTNQWVTLNQPPLWAYIASSIVLYVGSGLWAINLLFLAGVLASVWLAFEVVRLELSEMPSWLVAPLCLLGASHARILLQSGSTNFPDSMYALGLIAGLFALVRGNAGGYAGAGLATVLLRYAGCAPVVLAPILMALLFPGRRRASIRCLAWWLLATTSLCVAFLLAGVVRGELGDWLGILYFETFPEHFHDNYALEELLQRPPEFFRLLLLVTGYTPLLLLVARPRLSRMMALLALGYSVLLCFIDHFPSHYFVPLIYLVGISVVAGLGALSGWRRVVGTLLACGGIAYGLTLPL